MPNKTIFAFLGSLKIIEDISIRRKPKNINQKVPISSMVPKSDTWEAPENKEESKNAKTTPRPAKRDGDFGKPICPSKNLAIAQKMTQMTSPSTKSSPLEVSIGILVNGKKKNGSNIMTKKSDKNENLSKIL